MKLICSIKPRSDGTVAVYGDGKTYAFTPTGDGETAADVPDALASKLLATGNFYPAEKVAEPAPTQAAAVPVSAPAAVPAVKPATGRKASA